MSKIEFFDRGLSHEDLVRGVKKFGRETNDLALFETKNGIFAYSNANVKKRDNVKVSLFSLPIGRYKGLPEMISDVNHFGGVFQIVQIMPYEFFDKNDLLVVYISSSQKRKLSDDEEKRWGLDFA